MSAATLAVCSMLIGISTTLTPLWCAVPEAAVLYLCIHLTEKQRA